MWYGLSWNTMFYKGLLDKLGVKAEVFRPTACKYKSAVEPFILDRMSDANRRQMQQVVNSLWETINRSRIARHCGRGTQPHCRRLGGDAARRGAAPRFRGQPRV